MSNIIYLINMNLHKFILIYNRTTTKLKLYNQKMTFKIIHDDLLINFRFTYYIYIITHKLCVWKMLFFRIFL